MKERTLPPTMTKIGLISKRKCSSIKKRCILAGAVSSLLCPSVNSLSNAFIKNPDRNEVYHSSDVLLRTCTLNLNSVIHHRSGKHCVRPIVSKRLRTICRNEINEEKNVPGQRRHKILSTIKNIIPRRQKKSESLTSRLNMYSKSLKEAESDSIKSSRDKGNFFTCSIT